MTYMKRILTAIAIVIAAASCAKQGPVTDVQTLTSPSGNMEMTFQLTADGTPQYALNYGDQKVILPSPTSQTSVQFSCSVISDSL